MGLEKLSSNVWSHYLKIYVWLEGRALYRLRLVWEEDGFLLIYKRLEAGTFQWPRSEAEARNITSEQYHLLMSGYSIDPSVHKIDPKHPV